MESISKTWMYKSKVTYPTRGYSYEKNHQHCSHLCAVSTATFKIVSKYFLC